jgi:hypothetical protein
MNRGNMLSARSYCDRMLWESGPAHRRSPRLAEAQPAPPEPTPSSRSRAFGAPEQPIVRVIFGGCFVKPWSCRDWIRRLQHQPVSQHLAAETACLLKPHCIVQRTGHISDSCKCRCVGKSWLAASDRSWSSPTRVSAAETTLL